MPQPRAPRTWGRAWVRVRPGNKLKPRNKAGPENEVGLGTKVGPENKVGPGKKMGPPIIVLPIARCCGSSVTSERVAIPGVSYCSGIGKR